MKKFSKQERKQRAIDARNRRLILGSIPVFAAFIICVMLIATTQTEVAQTAASRTFNPERITVDVWNACPNPDTDSKWINDRTSIYHVPKGTPNRFGITSTDDPNPELFMYNFRSRDKE